MQKTRFQSRAFWALSVALLAAGSLFALTHALIRAEAQALSAAAEPCPSVLIVDAGHGGEDGGAVSAGGLPEADLNLAIAQRVEALALLAGVPVQMTRSTAEITYPDSAATVAARKAADQKRRVALVNSIPNAVLLSIHQNCFPGKAPHGAQVLYGAADGSEAFGTLLHENLTAYLDPENRRVAAPISEKIYLLRNVRCPAVLVECGFLSNPEEAARLADSGYQTKLAAVLLTSYLQHRQTGRIP